MLSFVSSVRSCCVQSSPGGFSHVMSVESSSGALRYGLMSLVESVQAGHGVSR